MFSNLCQVCACERGFELKAVARSVRMWMNAGGWVACSQTCVNTKAPTPAPVILATRARTWMAIPVKQQVNGAGNISTVGWELEVLWHPLIPMQISSQVLSVPALLLFVFRTRQAQFQKPPFTLVFYTLNLNLKVSTNKALILQNP